MGKLPWLKRRRKTAPDLAIEPPVLLQSHSNGEYFHEATPRDRLIRDLILKRAAVLCQRVGLDRREFLASTMGMATSLAVINMVSCRENGNSGIGSTSSSTSMGSTSNGYDLGGGTETDGLECVPLGGDEFIFDIQTHHINPQGPWRETNPGYVQFFEGLDQAACGLEPLECLSAEQYIEQIFLNSDTTVAVLSGVPADLCGGANMTSCGNPLDNMEIVASRELINTLASSQRSVNHCLVMPNLVLEQQLDVMQQVHEESGIGGWKCYTPWGPTGTGWWLDDPAIGIPFIERGLSLGVDVFCCHKGLPLLGFDAVHTDPRDVGVVASMFPAAKFVVYHSAWLHGTTGPGQTEGPYDPMNAWGVNSLIKSVEDNGLGPGSNVYAELGSTWLLLMTEPDQAAHVLGKLLVHLGEDNVLWGTDTIWSGSPQPQIEAFRAFQISEQFQEMYGYPALTDSIKRKILGLNAAAVYGVDPDEMRCAIDQTRLARAKRELDGELGARRWTAQPPLGPRTRREFLRLHRHNDGRPS